MIKELTWTKKLSKTDAQQETKGGLVPYLRLTKGSLKDQDFQEWFRFEFFKGHPWHDGQFGREQGVQLCKVNIEATFEGVILGNMIFKVSYGPNRWEQNNTPSTWLHWPETLQRYLQKDDMTEKLVTLVRYQDGSYSITLGD